MALVLVQCIEPNALPLMVEHEVRLLETFRLFVLSDTRGAGASALRQTILLSADEDPPPEATLVFELDVYDPGAGDSIVFRVRRMGARVYIDWLRPNVRSRIGEGNELPTGARLEVILQDARRIVITLQMESELLQSSVDAIGGGVYRHKAKDEGSAAWYLYYSFFQLMVMNTTLLRDKINLWLRRRGLHPWVVLAILSVGSLLLLAGWMAYNQHKAAQAAEEKSKALEEINARVEEARQNALDNEMACLQERQSLARRLQDIEESYKALISQAINYTFSQSVSVEVGGNRMGDDSLMPFDEQYQANTTQAILDRMESVPGDAVAMSFCMQQEQVLGVDLPRYILTWHPDPNVVCPLNYAIVDNGIDRKGSWGLSERVAKEFGAQNYSEGGQAGADQLEAQLGSPRMAPRWSATTLAIGIREIQFTLLTADTGGRPPVAPGQAQIWSLAIWDAYNRVPSPAGGVMDKPVGYCVDEMLDRLTSTAGVSEPGAPVLPDIAMVANENRSLVVPPSPSCPWPADAFTLGTKSALRAVVNMSYYLDHENNEPSETDAN
ncbi:MAG: hypothetical protein ACON4U_11155 [Myxococcota bacterium]